MRQSAHIDGRISLRSSFTSAVAQMDGALSPKETTLRHPPRLNVHIFQSQLITGHMRRFRLRGDDLKEFQAPFPAQCMKVFFPPDYREGRLYTIRHFDSSVPEMTLDFVLHDHGGVAAAWASTACTGDVLQISGPKHGYHSDTETQRLFFFGDETAIPAIAAITENLSHGMKAMAFVEVHDKSAALPNLTTEHVEFNWLYRNGCDAGTTDILPNMARYLEIPDGNCRFWIAAEASTVREIRKVLLERGVQKWMLTSAAYWKRGVSEHHDTPL